jgi:sugar O-acyltransferase (sialic acid O-acetyltransferase NeuD family)
MTTYKKIKKIILFGTGDLAQIAKLYFERDTVYKVVGFTVDDKYLKENTLMGLPVVPFSSVTTSFPPQTHDIHVCLIYNDMNRLRAKKCKEAEEMGYKLASYISSAAFVAPTAKIGKHALIFENNVIQDFVEIGENVILWSGNHVGHHSKIEDRVFVSSHVVISGHCVVGANSFLGVNSTLANGTTIGKETWVSHGSVLSGDIPAHSMVTSPVRSSVTALNEEALTKALEKARR